MSLMSSSGIELATTLESKRISAVDDIRHTVWQSDLEAIPIGRDESDGIATYYTLADCTLTVGRFDGRVRILGDMQPNMTTFGTLFSIVGNATHWGRETFRGDLAIFADGGYQDAVYQAASFDYAVLAVPTCEVYSLFSVIAPHLLSVIGHSAKLDLDQLAREQCRSAFLRFWVGLEDLAASGQTLDVQQRRSALIAMLGALAHTLDSTGRPPEDAVSNAPRQHRLLRQAEELVRSPHGSQIKSVPELCLALGVTRRSLERAFRDCINTSPAQYLLWVRLAAARKELRTGAGGVTEIATRHGFYELGRFAMRYRQLFGEKPSDTLRAAPPRNA